MTAAVFHPAAAVDIGVVVDMVVVAIAAADEVGFDEDGGGHCGDPCPAQRALQPRVLHQAYPQAAGHPNHCASFRRLQTGSFCAVLHFLSRG